MKKVLTMLLSFFAVFTIAQTPATDDHWELIWKDEFNTLDRNRWRVIHHEDHQSGLEETIEAGEPQVYLDDIDNVFIDSGELVLKLIYEEYSCCDEFLPDSCPSWSDTNQYKCSREWRWGVPYDYTSGQVQTWETVNVRYGYIEAKISISPYATAIFPAFWTYRSDSYIHDTESEIDIFEMLGNNYQTPNIFTSNLHTVYGVDEGFFVQGVINDYQNPHIYGVEWSPSRIIWYIDDVPVRITDNPNIDDYVVIILNLALQSGGTWPTSSELPVEMRVDYVSYYTLKEDCDQYIDELNYDFSTYDYKVKDYISIGGSTSTNTVSTNDDIYMRASQYIDIKEVTVPLGAGLYLDANDECEINPCDGDMIVCASNFEFDNYENTVKQTIDLGGADCQVYVDPTGSHALILEATEGIAIRNGVEITPESGSSVHLKIGSCD